jgi:hypothetical protein
VRRQAHLGDLGVGTCGQRVEGGHGRILVFRLAPTKG